MQKLTPFTLVLATFSAIFALFFASVQPASAASDPRMQGVSPPEAVPALSLQAADGVAVDLTEQRGKVVLLHFWATWCPPCIDELPELVAFAKEHEAEGVVLLPISEDRAAEKVEAFYAERNLVAPVILDQAMMAMRALNIRGLPSTMVLDTEGRIVMRIEGRVDWKDAAIQAPVLGLLKAPQTPTQNAE